MHAILKQSIRFLHIKEMVRLGWLLLGNSLFNLIIKWTIRIDTFTLDLYMRKCYAKTKQKRTYATHMNDY